MQETRGKIKVKFDVSDAVVRGLSVTRGTRGLVRTTKTAHGQLDRSFLFVLRSTIMLFLPQMLSFLIARPRCISFL